MYYVNNKDKVDAQKTTITISYILPLRQQTAAVKTFSVCENSCGKCFVALR